jgi:hypothetical protein
LSDIPDDQSIDQRAAVAPDYDRIEVIGFVQNRPSRVTQLNLGGDFDVVLGGEFPGVIEHLFRELLGGLLNILLESE